MRESFKIAHISAAHGIRGEVKLACFLENPDDITRYNPLVSKQGKSYNVRITGHTKDHLMVAIDGITDRNAAELLRGVELYGDSSKLPPASDDEYFVADLIGLTAMLENGSEIGKVTALHNYGAGDILEIKTTDDELLLPFKLPFVGEIKDGKIIVTLPEYMGEENE